LSSLGLVALCAGAAAILGGGVETVEVCAGRDGGGLYVRHNVPAHTRPG
jgi:hypothetical protein